jgi:hypothetical protein
MGIIIVSRQSLLSHLLRIVYLSLAEIELIAICNGLQLNVIYGYGAIDKQNMAIMLNVTGMAAIIKEFKETHIKQRFKGLTKLVASLMGTISIRTRNTICKQM